MNSLLIVGSSGLLGSTLVKLLEKFYDIKTITRTSENSDYCLDMSDTSLALTKLREIEPNYIINLAALTDVDKCETDIDSAYRINTRIAENIALYNRENKACFTIHISTDHYYDENESSEDMVNIYNAYAMTKYCAEKALNLENSTILRTNFFGKSWSTRSLGLCDSVYNAVKNGGNLKLFNDVYFSPLSINTLCDVIKLCLEKRNPGIFNVGSKQGMSKQDFLTAFLQECGFEGFSFDSVSVDSMNFKVRRPKDMRMNVSHFEQTFNYKLPLLLEEIKSVANEFR
ncbi:SDR family oxidoreductase [Vibrio vulnificus]